MLTFYAAPNTGTSAIQSLYLYQVQLNSQQQAAFGAALRSAQAAYHLHVVCSACYYM
jgi:uncharacterized membrane protein